MYTTSFNSIAAAYEAFKPLYINNAIDSNAI